MAVSFKNENSFNFLPHLMISLISYGRPTPFKSVTMATRNALFPILKFHFTDTYLGKVTKFQFNCFSRLGAPIRLGLRSLFTINVNGHFSGSTYGL